MTNSSVKNSVSVLAIFALSIALFSGAIVSVVHADDAQSFGGTFDAQSFGGGGYDAQSFGGGEYDAQSFGAGGYDAQSFGGSGYDAQSFGGGGNTYDAQSFGGNTYDAQSFGGNTYDAQAFGGDTYDAQAFGGGTSYPYGGTYYPYGGTYSDYGGYPSYGSTGYGYASLGIGLGFGTGFYPTSTFFPTTTFVPTQVASVFPTTTFVPTQPNNVFVPTVASAPSTTYAPTNVYSPTDTFTYAPTSNTTSVYSPSDSHNVVGPVTTDSHNNTTVTVVSNTSQAAPQYPVQYVSSGYSYGGGSYFTPSYYNTPTYFPTYAAPYCTITASNSGYNYNYGNGATVLSWNSNNANSGYITPLVGTVAPSGSTTIYPNQNTLYTLTVSGNGGTSSCQTYTTAYGNYVAPATYQAPVAYQAAAVAPYVALTQIPYTGFDFGTFGNAIYWTLLALFAVAVSYLALYFRGGAFAFIGSLIRGNGSRGVTLLTSQGVTSEVAKVENSRGDTSQSRGVTSVGGPSTGAATTGGTKDSMLSVGATEGGIGPRIVVLRS
ncbi:MAG: hypothetical protein Q7S08_01810 [bacterium]|nr:hypothetical protein [bacterium]